MNFKESFLFVATCLTINKEPKNLLLIEKTLKSKKIDWDRVVQVSTSHYVLPALYCNLKQANFLNYLTSDLKQYMEFITNENRMRNKKIISQSIKINNLLISKNISPVFIKGTCNLLSGLYDDIAERMIGDIDFIVPKSGFHNLINILKDNGYSKFDTNKFFYQSERHYPRLVNKNEIAAVEVHKDLLNNKYKFEYNFSSIENNIQVLDKINLLSYSDMMSISVFSNQINDYGHHLMNISLRNAYDVFLLSKKTNPLVTLSKFTKLKHPLNCFIAISNYIFNDISSLKFNRTLQSDIYLNKFIYVFFNTKSLDYWFKYYFFHFSRRLKLFFNSLISSEGRSWLSKKITYYIFSFFKKISK